MPSMLTAAADAACACPTCGKVLRVKLSFAGRLARCRCCNSSLKIPTRRELIDFAASVLITEDVSEEMSHRQSIADRRARGEEIPVEDPFAEMGAR